MKQIILSSIFAIIFSGCATVGHMMNPFYEEPSPLAYKGELNDDALSGGQEKVDTARQALENLSSYQQANAPQPVNPVIQPAVVRVMWIPDHLNRNGDLVPSHYYYLKILKDRWAVSDAFELESQLGGGGSGDSNIPFVYDSERMGKR